MPESEDVISDSLTFKLVESLVASVVEFAWAVLVDDLADFRPLRFFGRVFFFVPENYIWKMTN